MKYLINRVVLFLLVWGMAISSVMAQNWTGTWRSDYGDLHLHQGDNSILGDYASLGVLYGGMSIDASGKPFIEGVFENYSSRKTGLFKFRVDPANPGKFTGEWTWAHPDLVNCKPWNGTRTTASKPTRGSFCRVLERADDQNWNQVNENYDIHFRKNGFLYFHTKGINSKYGLLLPTGDWEVEIKNSPHRSFETSLPAGLSH